MLKSLEIFLSIYVRFEPRSRYRTSILIFRTDNFLKNLNQRYQIRMRLQNSNTILQSIGDHWFHWNN